MCYCSQWNSCWTPVCCQPTACPAQITLSGTVTGLSGIVPNLPIAFTINGIATTTTTDASGRYTIIAPHGAVVTITPQLGLGVVATPPSYTLNACQDRNDLNFVLTVV